MYMGNSHRNKMFKDSEVILCMYRISDFRSENGRSIGSEEEQNTQGRKILMRQLRNKETQGYLADRSLYKALLFTTLN